MSKAKSLSRRKNRKPESQLQQAVKHLSKQMLEVLLAVLAIVGFGITLLTAFPRISVSNSTAIDLSDPFSSPFVISNDGYLPLYNVKFSVAMRRVDTIGGGGIIGTGYSSRFTTPDFVATVFRPTERFSLYAGRILRAPGAISYADVAIVVEYRPMFWPRRRERVFRFVTEKGADGNLYWMARTLEN